MNTILIFLAFLAVAAGVYYFAFYTKGKINDRDGDFIPDETQLSPVDQASKQLLKDHLDEVLATLSEREAKVLKLRFGLEGNKQMTLEEVGKVFGVTRERIRQIEAKALRKLKHPAKRSKVKIFYDD